VGVLDAVGPGVVLGSGVGLSVGVGSVVGVGSAVGVGSIVGEGSGVGLGSVVGVGSTVGVAEGSGQGLALGSHTCATACEASPNCVPATSAHTSRPSRNLFTEKRNSFRQRWGAADGAPYQGHGRHRKTGRPRNPDESLNGG
jgi:carbonic anhydrase/acetyltransferase-like protein (isoleucine patch superfamily)